MCGYIQSKLVPFVRRGCPCSVFYYIFSELVITIFEQALRDEEGKKLGLQASGKSSSSKDNDVKMTDAVVCY